MPLKTRIYGEHDEKTIRQLDRCMQAGSAAKGVLCADGHLGYAHPIGGVIAYEEHISISGVGFDIACGNMAVRLDTRYEDIAGQTGRILSDIGRSISFGIGQKNAVTVDHALFESPLWDEAGVRDLKKLASGQLGTVGSGNHYVDLFEDEEGFVWIGVHFGSRGLGHKITTKHLALVGAKDGMEVDPALVHQDSEVGRSYIAGVKLGGLYAYAGREWVVERVRRIIGGQVTDTVHNHHNFVWRETHGSKDYWVVRKGATPAFPGQRGFVGGSMGDNAVILHGIDTLESADSLYSTVHGAGRLFGRMEAKGKNCEHAHALQHRSLHFRSMRRHNPAVNGTTRAAGCHHSGYGGDRRARPPGADRPWGSRPHRRPAGGCLCRAAMHPFDHG